MLQISVGAELRVGPR